MLSTNKVGGTKDEKTIKEYIKKQSEDRIEGA
jgi:hypothetical protein